MGLTAQSQEIKPTQGLANLPFIEQANESYLEYFVPHGAQHETRECTLIFESNTDDCRVDFDGWSEAWSYCKGSQFHIALSLDEGKKLLRKVPFGIVESQTTCWKKHE